MSLAKSDPPAAGISSHCKLSEVVKKQAEYSLWGVRGQSGLTEFMKRTVSFYKEIGITSCTLTIKQTARCHTLRFSHLSHDCKDGTQDHPYFSLHVSTPPSLRHITLISLGKLIKCQSQLTWLRKNDKITGKLASTMFVFIGNTWNIKNCCYSPMNGGLIRLTSHACGITKSRTVVWKIEDSRHDPCNDDAVYSSLTPRLWVTRKLRPDESEHQSDSDSSSDPCSTSS